MLRRGGELRGHAAGDEPGARLSGRGLVPPARHALPRRRPHADAAHLHPRPHFFVAVPEPEEHDAVPTSSRTATIGARAATKKRAGPAWRCRRGTPGEGRRPRRRRPPRLGAGRRGRRRCRASGRTAACTIMALRPTSPQPPPRRSRSGAWTGRWRTAWGGAPSAATSPRRPPRCSPDR